jgi:acetyltransferase
MLAAPSSSVDAALAWRSEFAASPVKRRPESGFVLRPIRPGEGEGLQTYFRRLSPAARYYRLFGGASELPASELARALAADGVDTLTLLLAYRAADRETIVGEARVAFSGVAREGEFAISMAEGWRRMGLGSALIAGIENLARQSGAAWLFGDVLRDNAAMIALACSQGFRLEPGLETRLVRVRKRLSDASRVTPHDADLVWQA